MGTDKKILVTIPAEFNKELDLHLINIRYKGIDITKADLLLRLAEIGLKFEQIGKIKTISKHIRDDAPGLKNVKS